MFRRYFASRRPFSSLDIREILALAILAEEEDSRIYADFARELRPTHPTTAKIFDSMAVEEEEHRRLLLDVFLERFGEKIPPIRREHVSGFPTRPPFWKIKLKGIDVIRNYAAALEADAANFYSKAAERCTDVEVRKLLGDLAQAELRHRDQATHAREAAATSFPDEDETERRRFLLQAVQPGLVGLMDGSVSTLAPLFAAAFATQDTWATFLVGMAASVGAGISMGFAEGLSDDGSLTGRGRPFIRGLIAGTMTTVGGVGHTLPYLVSSFPVATTLAIIVVAIELWCIAWIRSRYMDTPFLRASFEIVVGGVLVFFAGILIGHG